MEYAGFPVNWASSAGVTNILIHPLYVKYNSKTFADLVVNDVKADPNGSLATAESASICAYLSWLLRTLALVA